MLQTVPRGNGSLGRDVMLQTEQGGNWSGRDVMLQTVQGVKGSVWKIVIDLQGGRVVRERRDFIVSAMGKWTVGRDVMLQPVQGVKGSSGET